MSCEVGVDVDVVVAGSVGIDGTCGDGKHW